MTAYRLSPLRAKGWLRIGAVGAAIMLPITVMEHALGFFNDGVLGLRQASEFLVGGIGAWMIFGICGSWAVRGFMIRAKETDEDQDERDSRPHPSGSGAPHPSAPPHTGGARPAPGHGKPHA